jgi:iron complex outermembrane receptor protein
MVKAVQWVCAIAAVGLGDVVAVPAAAWAQDTNPITRMSLEYLMNVEVTTVSREPERVQTSAAAVHVLTREEIQRAGVTELPEALRMVPGVNVARINANSWAVSIRGFNSRFANKLLVMNDGRSIYSPLYSGVFWDRHNIPVDDIERIEVVRGPGGTLWGANAVNGVINIITRHSAQTQGQRLEIGVGTDVDGLISARHGGVIGDKATYRLSTQFDSRDSTDLEGYDDGNDRWRNGQAHLRVDWTPSARDDVLVTAGVNSVSGGDKYTAPTLSAPYSMVKEGDIDRHGAYLLSRWERRLSANSSFSLQGFLDHRYMDIDVPMAEETRTTADLQALHRSVIGPDIAVTWGAGYRFIDDRTETDTFGFEIDPNDETIHIFNGYVQGSRKFFDDSVEFTLGTKIEHHSISGTEVQPAVRGAWSVTPQHTIWSAVSQAVRTPARGETDGIVRNVVVPPNTPFNPSALPLTIAIQGDRDLDAERITAYEVGYRGRLSRTVSLDVAGFFNSYDGLLLNAATGETTVNTDFGTPFLDTAAVIDETADGETYGAEVAGTWQARPDLRLRGGYSWLYEDLDATDGAEGNAPRHQIAVQSLYDFAQDWRFDTVVRFVDELSNLDADGYVDLDARLSWSPTERLELAISGRNLLTDGRREFGQERVANPAPLATDVSRSVFASLVVKF